MQIYARLVGWDFDRFGDHYIAEVYEGRLVDGKWVAHGDNRIRSAAKFVAQADFCGDGGIVDVEIGWDHQDSTGEWRSRGWWSFALINRIPTSPGSWKVEHWCVYFGGAWVPLVKILQIMEDSIDGA